MLGTFDEMRAFLARRADWPGLAQIRYRNENAAPRQGRATDVLAHFAERKPVTGAGAVAGLVTGAAVVAAWIALGLNSDFIGGQGLYEIVPGFIAAWLAIVLVSNATGTARTTRG